MASGGLLPAHGHYTEGVTTFEAWLAARGLDGSVSVGWPAGSQLPTDSGPGTTCG